MNGKPDSVVETVDEVGQAKQIVDLVKENKMMTALVVFVLWQTGSLITAWNQLQGGLC